MLFAFYCLVFAIDWLAPFFFKRASWVRSCRARGNYFLADLQQVCLLKLLPSIKPVAYLIQHVIHSCVILRKGQNPSRGEAVFNWYERAHKSQADLFSMARKQIGPLGKCPATVLLLTFKMNSVCCYAEPWTMLLMTSTDTGTRAFPGEIPSW